MGKNLTELNQLIRDLESFGIAANTKEKFLVLAEGGGALLKKEPLAVLRAIALAAEWEFTLDGALLAGMKDASAHLADKNPEALREEFEWILMAKHASVGLQMAFAADIFPYLLGSECFPPKSRAEQNDFAILMENIDRTNFDTQLRYALLFICFEKNKAVAAIKRLRFPKEEEALLVQAPELIVDLHFAVRPLEFKRFLVKHGWETYEFIEGVTKQQRKMYDHGENRILSRFYMLQDFEKNKIPVFRSDMKIGERDLEEMGITDADLRESIMTTLLNDVHIRPQNNRREVLLKKAKAYKNPLLRAWGKVRWIK